MSTAAVSNASRAHDVNVALRLEWLTVGWNIIEGVVAVTAAVLANSVVLLGFGVDSFVESVSGLVMVWRLRVERTGAVGEDELEAIENRARRLVGISLFLLAVYVSFDAVRTLFNREKPDFSATGVALTSLSILVMVWLARAKRQVAQKLGSRALAADAVQTMACWWLSLAALVGVGLNGLLAWWWADPLAALVIAMLIAREGKEAWEGDEH